jgi:predicted enzyme related to lactoylglutathione lyase
MEEITKHPNNTFSWVDLATNGAEEAKKFYKAVFNWDFIDEPFGDGMFYTMCMINNKPVAAIFEMPEEQKKMGMPPYWMPYITIENADETAEKIKAAGGEIIAPPMEVFDNGRMAVVQDVSGAVFAIWQAKGSIGASYKDIPGAMSWVELGVFNTEKPKKFYSEVFSWKEKTEKMGSSNDYTTFFFGEGPMDMAGGMYQMTEEMKDIPPHWLSYFMVAKTSDTLEIVKENKGEVLMGPMFIEGIGNFAVIRDPQGGVFGIIGE